MRVMWFLVATMIVGCERPYDIEPTSATHESYCDQIDIDALPKKTRQLYDHLLDGNLTGAKAAEFQPLLDTAVRIIDRSEVIFYLFQLTGFPRPYHEVEEEGVPVMIVKVQKSYGVIFYADITSPEF